MNSERIASMNKEDLTRLLKFLYEEKKLDDVIDDYLAFAPPVNIQLSIEWLHANVCSSAHPPCRFYDEEECTGTWSSPDHSYWMNMYESLRTKCHLTDSEFAKSIDLVRYLQAETSSRRKIYGYSPELLAKLLKEKPDLLSPIPQTASCPEPPAESLDEYEGIEAEIVQLLETGPQGQ